MEHATISFILDDQDRILSVNEGWVEFALANDGRALLPANVIGTSLWQHVGDDTVRTLYRMLLRRAREGCPIAFRYRCDAPDRRRTFEMRLGSLRSEQVESVSVLLHDEPRAVQPLLDPAIPREPWAVSVCSWCQKVRLPDRTWVPVEVAVEHGGYLGREKLPALTHGICDTCYRSVMAQFGPPAAP